MSRRKAEPAFPKESAIPASIIAECLAFVTANKDRPGGAELQIKLERMIERRNEVARGT